MSELLAFGIFVAGGLSGWLLGVLSDVAKPRLVARINGWIDAAAAKKQEDKKRKARTAAVALEAAELDRLRAERCGVRFRRHPDPENPSDVGRVGEVIDLADPKREDVRVRWVYDDGAPSQIGKIAWRHLVKTANQQERATGWHEFERLEA